MSQTRIGFSEEFYLSKNELGYNFKLYGINRNVYFHCKGKKSFIDGDRFLISYQDSSLVPGRLDALSIDPVKDLHGAIDKCWPDPTKRKLLFETIKSDKKATLYYEQRFLAAILEIDLNEEVNTNQELYMLLSEAEQYSLLRPNAFYLMRNADFSKLSPELICTILNMLSDAQVYKLVFGWGRSNIFKNLNMLNEINAWTGSLTKVVTNWLKTPATAPVDLSRMSSGLYKRVFRHTVIPTTKNEIDNILPFLPLECRQILLDVTPLEYSGSYLTVISEARMVAYIISIYKDVSAEKLSEISDVAVKRNFFEAKFLIGMIDSWQRQVKVSVFSLVSQVQELQKLQFLHHALHRTKFSSVIFSHCFSGAKIIEYKGVRISNPKFTICEGKFVDLLKNTDIKTQALDSDKRFTLCRRSRCNDVAYSEHEVKTAGCKSHLSFPFYQLAFELFGIRAEDFHVNNDFLKHLSAFNRWNTILELLFCSSCEKPLSISEHSPGSIGHMAVGATYWHCGNENCSQFCNSIKIAYCIGCQKVIDSRKDTQSCNPYEIKSYNKIYICGECGSCCRKHNGFSGVCPSCGELKAFPIENNNTAASCRRCSHKISVPKIPWDKYKNNIVNRYSSTNAATGKCVFKFVENISSIDSTQIASIDLSWNANILYVYDLFSCLASGNLTHSQIKSYEQIYDIALIERIVFLGLDHPRYVISNTCKIRVMDILKRANSQNVQHELEKYLKFLFDSMDAELWNHYNNVEFPFVFSLRNLVGNGINVDKKLIQSKFPVLEKHRNVVVNDLLEMGVGNPDYNSAKTYLAHHYSSEDAEILSRIFQRLGVKTLASRDALFEKLHVIEKIERGAVILKKLMLLPNPVIPNYQIMGTVTGRCTAKNPNLLSLPREYRSVVRSENGTAIAECDYKQMEVGILAALAHDENLIDDFNNKDVYECFANDLGLSRDEAKSIFISILYGMSPASLGRLLGQDENTASHLINEFYKKYPRVKIYQDELIVHGSKFGYVSTVTGLKRKLDALKNINQLSSWEKNWLRNFPAQANAAVVFKTAIIDLGVNIFGSEFKMLVPHYDSIVFQAPSGYLDKYIKIVESSMIRAMKKYFPMLSPKISVKRDTPDFWS